MISFLQTGVWVFAFRQALLRLNLPMWILPKAPVILLPRKKPRLTFIRVLSRSCR